MRGLWILTVMLASCQPVAATADQLSDEVEDVVQTALRCLSRKDLEAAR